MTEKLPINLNEWRAEQMRAPQYQPFKHVSALGTFYISWRSHIDRRGIATMLHVRPEIDFYELSDGSFGSQYTSAQEHVFEECGISARFDSITIPEVVYEGEFVRVTIRDLMYDLEQWKDDYPVQYEQAEKEARR